MIKYALRHVATGHFMPSIKGGQGYSHWQPTAMLKHFGIAAKVSNDLRLFDDRRSAELARSFWVRGTARNMEVGDTSSVYYGYYGTVYTPCGRDLQDLEVVEFELVERVKTPKTLEGPFNHPY